MSRDYVVIWRDELDSDNVFNEYCSMKNAIQVNDEFEPDDEGDGVRFYTVPERNKIVVPITEGDADEFKDVAWGNSAFSWCFNTQDGVPIDVHFVAEEDEDEEV